MEELRAKAREKPDRTWGGPGVGAVCAVCDLPVALVALGAAAFWWLVP